MKMAAWAPVAFLLTCACAAPRTAGYGSWTAGPGYIEAIGKGVPDAASAGDVQKRYTSREAARIDAQARLLRAIEQLPMDQAGSAAAAEQKDPKFADGLQAAIHGAIETQAAWDASDNCTVTLRLDKAALKALDSRFKF